jgi:hypothetical protein
MAHTRDPWLANPQPDGKICPEKQEINVDVHHQYMGVSENSVPPQWLMIIIPIKWLFHWEYTLFSDKPL